MPVVPAPVRTRLTPEARRRQILEVARRLFASRPYAEVTVAEIAHGAGVTRALVHHYFGTVREIYLAVLAELTAEGIEIPGEIEGLSRAERVGRNIDAWLELIDANRETWLAVAAQGTAIPDSHIRALIEVGRESAIERMIAANSDVLRDTAAVRFALRAVFALMQSACEQWLSGTVDRKQARALITGVFLDLVERTIPALESSAG